MSPRTGEFPKLATRSGEVPAAAPSPRSGEFTRLDILGIDYETRLPRTYRNRKRFEPPNPKLVKAVIPSVVRAVRAEAGQTVRKGQPLLLLEAMKMQNELLAPLDGRLKAVNVAVGEMVPKTKVLVEYE